ncbi:MAG TPA: SiaB family protein kinase [Bacteroidales bacterium]|nr:SiaB family protein kinase [Bacteroidales bacterium]
MNTKTTFWFFDRIHEDNLCLLYNGRFSDEITNKLIELSEYNINNIDALSKMKKKASFLMAECFQNIIRHGESTDKQEEKVVNEGFFLTKNWQGIYYITSGNLIDNKKIENLERQLQKVNSLDKEELKVLYREVLENQEISDKGGAGLGLIEMARKSGQKLEYKFEDFNSQYSLFYNQILLKAENEECSDDCPFKLSEAIGYHQKMVEEKILVIHKGDFSQDAIFPVLKIIEENLRKQHHDSASKKKIFHIMVELLQNISHHCIKEENKREGIFLIGKTDDYFVINTGNHIENSEVEKFRKQLEYLNNLNGKELKELYLSKLRERNSHNDGVGIGLVDIARRLISPINYSFEKIDETKTFVSLNVIA